VPLVGGGFLEFLGGGGKKKTLAKGGSKFGGESPDELQRENEKKGVPNFVLKRREGWFQKEEHKVACTSQRESEEKFLNFLGETSKILSVEPEKNQ